jgi:hypothetical protein
MRTERSFIERLKLSMSFRFSELYNTRDPVDESFSLAEMAEKLISIDKFKWGYIYAFSRDPLKARVSEDEKIELTKKAIECGEKYADLIKREYGNLSPRVLVEKLGIKINILKGLTHSGALSFSEFIEPENINLNDEFLNNGKIHLEDPAVKKNLYKGNIEDILIAHELFHVLEMLDKEKVFTRTFKICLWKIPFFKNNSRLICLSEIAAMAFVSRYLDLGFSAYVYDVLFTYCFNTEESYRLFDEICRKMINKELNQVGIEN